MINQDKFYRALMFYSLDDLRRQGKAQNKRYNNTPKLVLNFKTPNEVEFEKYSKLLEDLGEMRSGNCLTSFKVDNIVKIFFTFELTYIFFKSKIKKY